MVKAESQSQSWSNQKEFVFWLNINNNNRKGKWNWPGPIVKNVINNLVIISIKKNCIILKLPKLIRHEDIFICLLKMIPLIAISFDLIVKIKKKKTFRFIDIKRSYCIAHDTCSIERNAWWALGLMQTDVYMKRTFFRGDRTQATLLCEFEFCKKHVPHWVPKTFLQSTIDLYEIRIYIEATNDAAMVQRRHRTETRFQRAVGDCLWPYRVCTYQTLFIHEEEKSNKNKPDTPRQCRAQRSRACVCVKHCMVELGERKPYSS